MSSLDIDHLEEVRRSICGNCEHYNRKKDACTFVALKTGKLGLLKHHYGIRNPKTRCAYFYERKWNFVPSFYAWEINRTIMSITPKEVYEYTKAKYLSPFTILDRIYLKYEKMPGEYPPKRSVVVQSIRRLNAQPNEYQHVGHLHVNYASGELSYE